MAKSKSAAGVKKLRESLRSRGLRGRVAEKVAAAIEPGRPRKQPPKAIRQVVENLRSMAGEIEDRSTGGPAKRSAAAKKGVLTRKRRAATGRTPATKPAPTGKKRPA